MMTAVGGDLVSQGCKVDSNSVTWSNESTYGFYELEKWQEFMLRQVLLLSETQ